MILTGAIVPHAPLLIEDLAHNETANACARVAEALEVGTGGDHDVVVVLSPHGDSTGVYRTVEGTLDDFGVRNVKLRTLSDDQGARLVADRWQAAVLDPPIDHGVLVPLLLCGVRGVPVIAATLPEGASVEESLAHASRFADVVRTLAASRRVLFLASAHTSGALTPRAPFGELPEAVALDRRLAAAVADDAGAAEDLARDIANVGRSCGAGPLGAFGRMFRGTPAQVLAREAPVGVGYLVARARS